MLPVTFMQRVTVGVAVLAVMEFMLSAVAVLPIRLLLIVKAVWALAVVIPKNP